MHRHTHFTADTYYKSLPQVNTTRTAVVNALRSQPLTGDEVILVSWCRTGQIAHELSAQLKGNGKVIACDDADDMLEHAKSLPVKAKNVEYRKCDFTEALTQPDEKADIVISSWHIPFIPENSQLSYLCNLHNHLKEGGRLILLFPLPGSTLSEIIRDVTKTDNWRNYFLQADIKRPDFTTDAFAALIEKAGFDPAEVNQKPVAHQFNNVQELKNFVITALARYLPYLNSETLRAKLVDEVTSTYLGKVEHTDKRIPYHVKMMTAVTQRPSLEARHALNF